MLNMPITKNKNKPVGEVVLFTRFNGTEFYKKYSESAFLRSSRGRKFVLRVLSAAVQIRYELKDVKSITLKGTKLDDKEDLVIKKGSPEQRVGDFDFTLKRLQGFCAAYACAHPEKYDYNTIVAIAASLGYELMPNSTEDFRKFYFSFAPGSEHFSYVLGFWPSVATLVHLTLKKDEIKVKKSISKFRVKDDSKTKLMYQLKDKENLARIVPVVAEKIDGEKIIFAECLKAFNLHN